jgi:hypothetical protein
MQEKIKGGLADGLPDRMFDKRQIKMGMKIEREHTSDKSAQKEISKDHQVEFGNIYYPNLKKLESRLEKRLKNRHTKVFIRRKDRNRFKVSEVSMTALGLLVPYYGSRKKARKLHVPLFRSNGMIWQGRR